MANILLTNSDLVAVVDEQDHLTAILLCKWYLTHGYAIGDGQLYLHQFVASQKGIIGQADHKDRNKLNCTRDNLRQATQSQNIANRPKPHGVASVYKGVHVYAGRWRAQITVNYKKMHIGYYDHEWEAALAYNEVARKHFGEFAYLNEVK